MFLLFRGHILRLHLPGLFAFPFAFTSLSDSMRRRPPSTFFLTFTLILCFAFFSLHLSRNALRRNDLPIHPSTLAVQSFNSDANNVINHVIQEAVIGVLTTHTTTRHVSSVRPDSPSIDSLLLPDWEILVILSPDAPLLQSPGSVNEYNCIFQNNATSPARFSGSLPFTNRATFKCLMPNSVRRLRPFLQPILTKSSQKEWSILQTPRELMRWTFLAYEAISTEEDVVLLVKGVNHRQGTIRPPSQFKCVFGDNDDDNAVRTDVTSSAQEVFRCPHPNLAGFGEDVRIKISLEIVGEKSQVVPSVAYYTQEQKARVTKSKAKASVCACTMVYNVAKFLREWVMYHSKIGVEKFILYDNDSDDGLENEVEKLNGEGYMIERLFWIWPKTQEGGFSHSAVYASTSCTWVMYIDVDEFVFSPSWRRSREPSHRMIASLLPATPPRSESESESKSKSESESESSTRRIGQVSIKCYEYGPSNQRSHPAEGVTQGYTCRRRTEQRHKSVVLLDAVDWSLANVVHHFQMKKEYTTKQTRIGEWVINHYKYQAWPEFRRKFRRRVSTYVVDWKKAENLGSKDRAPGVGNEEVEPEGWEKKFCEVRDDALRRVTQRWLGEERRGGYRLRAS